MTQVTEATYDGGVLRPTRPLNLREHERVRIIVQQIEELTPERRAAAMARLRAGIASMGFRSEDAHPRRDARHERH